MSSLGSHSVLPREVPPPAALQRLTVAEIGEPCNCWAGTTSISASLVAGSSTTNSATVDLQCSPDQVVTATIGAWGPGGTFTGNHHIALCARMSAASTLDGYVFYIYTDCEGCSAGAGTVTLGLGIDNLVSPIATELTGQANPTAGTTLELSVIGTSIIAKRNGSALFTATDSTYTTGHHAGGEVFNSTTITGLQVVTTC